MHQVILYNKNNVVIVQTFFYCKVYRIPNYELSLNYLPVIIIPVNVNVECTYLKFKYIYYKIV